ncbi:nucleoside deaminase [Pararhizobium sp. DWP1-1-3]|uniref:nucleoside deaminase n=1 Tax=Pararhizobium sp. DWP1-1-3 TaxID=2804652 RepID=UPI003CF20860
MSDADRFMTQAVALARDNVRKGGRPFGAVLVIDGEVVATGVNGVMETHDPTAHAELVAVREAAIKRGSATLKGAAVYASGHPCPMCLAAMRLAGIHRHFLRLFERRRSPLWADIGAALCGSAQTFCRSADDIFLSSSAAGRRGGHLRLLAGNAAGLSQH